MTILREMEPVKAIIIAAALLCSAACSMRQATHDLIVQRGQVLKEWKEGEEDRLIMKEGNRIILYRVYSVSYAGGSAGQSEVLYAVDQVTRTCFAGPTQTQIQCRDLSRDSNMKPYVKWGPGESTDGASTSTSL